MAPVTVCVHYLVFRTLCTSSFPPLTPTHAPPRRCTGARNLLSLLAAPRKEPARCHWPPALTSLGTENADDRGLGLLGPSTALGMLPRAGPLRCTASLLCAPQATVNPEGLKCCCSTSQVLWLNPMQYSIPDPLASRTISKMERLTIKQKRSGNQ